MRLRGRFVVAVVLLLVGLSWPLAREASELFRSEPPALLPPMRVEKLARSEVSEAFRPAVDESEIRSAVAQRAHGLERCFKTQLRQRPTWGGRVELALELEDGQVVLAAVKQARSRDESVARCMAGVLRSVRLERMVTAQVIVPIELETRG